MKIHIKSYKYFTVVASVLSAVFIFFNWFKLSVPLLDSILKSDSISISFYSLPEFISEYGLLQFAINAAGKTTSLILLLVCTTLKYLCVLSAGLSIYGVVKILVKNKPSRFILSSQIIALVLNFLSIAVVVCFAVVMFFYSDSISQMAGISKEFLDINFLPTIWFYLSLASSVASVVFGAKYNKE